MFVPHSFFNLLGQGEFWKAFKLVIALVGKGFMGLVPSFSDFSPTQSLAYGLYLSPGLLGRAVLWLGLIWTGATAVVAWLIFRVRELARVQV